MTSRITSANQFPQPAAAAGSMPKLDRNFTIGNEDLVSAIEKELGGHIPPGTTMKAHYDKDATGAIKTTLYQPDDFSKIPLITFWRTYTVEVPGEGTYQFRKQIFTNVSMPEGKGIDEYQKALELASMACSIYSKLCNDAILVKGGGISKRNLDDHAITQLQKKSFVSIGLKMANFTDSKVRDKKAIEVKVGERTTTINFNEVKLGKVTSSRTRHEKFVIDNPTVKFTKERVKLFEKLFKSPEEFTNYYMNPASDSAKAFKDLHTERSGGLLREKLPFSPISSARLTEDDNVRNAFGEFGADLQRTIDTIGDQKKYMVENKPRKSWGIEWARLNKQQSKIEGMLNQLQSDWPGLFEDVQRNVRAMVNQSPEREPLAPRAPDAASVGNDRHLQEHIALAKRLRIDSSLQVKYARQTLLRDEFAEKVQSLTTAHANTLRTLEDANRTSLIPGIDPELKAALELEKKALEEMAKEQKRVLDRTKLEHEASELDLNILAINGRDKKFLVDGTLSADVQRMTKESAEKITQANKLVSEVPHATERALLEASEKTRALRTQFDGLFQQHLFAGSDEQKALDVQIRTLQEEFQALDALIRETPDSPLKELQVGKIRELEGLLNQLQVKGRIKLEIDNLAKTALTQFKAAGYIDKDRHETAFKEAIQLHLDTLRNAEANIAKAQGIVDFHVKKLQKFEDIKRRIGEEEVKLPALADEIAQIQARIRAPGYAYDAEVEERLFLLIDARESQEAYIETQRILARIQHMKQPHDSPARREWHQDWKNAVDSSKTARLIRDTHRAQLGIEPSPDNSGE